MIIDSHAHYAHFRFNGEHPYLCDRNGEWAEGRADRDQLLDDLKKNGIVGSIEPSIEFDSIEDQLALVYAHKDSMWAALGVHPTRCINTPWKKRKKLKKYAKENNVIAIGETGLDYHYPRKEQYRIRQKMWFMYQIMLSDCLKLPLVLHVRDADEDALKILKRHKKHLRGGVAHCFKSDHTVAEQYIELGFAIGVGGKLFSNNEEGEALKDTVKRVPLTSLLVETDAPLVLPDLRGSCFSNSKIGKLRNTSLILPAVIRKIAEIRGEDPESVEDAIYQNTLRVFNLKTK